MPAAARRHRQIIAFPSCAAESSPEPIQPTRRRNLRNLPAKPIKLAVEGKVLENAEKADQESENHPEPNEPSPILKSAESLQGKKEEDDVGDEKQEFHARAVGRGCAMKKPLAQDDQRKSCE